jgi:hypothetical protein
MDHQSTAPITAATGLWLVKRLTGYGLDFLEPKELVVIAWLDLRRILLVSAPTGHTNATVLGEVDQDRARSGITAQAQAAAVAFQTA